ncbi:MAG: ubiquinol-cytochrome c reductase iron-sulfur subunit [Janthinobacterium lividum]
MSELLKHPGESSNDQLSSEGKAAAHTRRKFLFKIAVALNGVVGLALAVPIVGYLLGPALQKDDDTGTWVPLGSLTGFPVGETTLVDFVSPVKSLGDGQTAKTACWVRRVSEQQFQVFAVNCAHLGCPVRWFAQSRLFLCPCHGGTYYETGERASGPPLRGLFKYRHKIEGDALIIHAGDMPTLATQASCGEKPLIQIKPAEPESSSSWQA